MRRWMVLAVVALGAAAVVSGVASSEGQPGEVRTVQVREGVYLRTEPRALAPKVVKLAFGTTVTIEETRDTYARVTTASGTGWLRSSDIVQPGALTGTATARTGGVASEVSLAGRQFDETTEGALKASEADLRAAYPLVDALERKSYKRGDPAVEAFAAEGRLEGAR
jgi:hypothetical protein